MSVDDYIGIPMSQFFRGLRLLEHSVSTEGGSDPGRTGRTATIPPSRRRNIPPRSSDPYKVTSRLEERDGKPYTTVDDPCPFVTGNKDTDDTQGSWHGRGGKAEGTKRLTVHNTWVTNGS